jgi:hypothetical protein
MFFLRIKSKLCNGTEMGGSGSEGFSLVFLSGSCPKITQMHQIYHATMRDLFLPK